jgi:hypothetical protein
MVMSWTTWDVSSWPTWDWAAAVGPPLRGSSLFVMVFSAAVIWEMKDESTLMAMMRDVLNARVGVVRRVDAAKRENLRSWEDIFDISGIIL